MTNFGNLFVGLATGAVALVLLNVAPTPVCVGLPGGAAPGILGFTLIAAATAFWRWRAGDIRGKIFFFAYFALMEALQCASYLVMNDCASKANQIMTALAW